jgi:hypothetical protein
MEFTAKTTQHQSRSNVLAPEQDIGKAHWLTAVVKTANILALL